MSKHTPHTPGPWRFDGQAYIWGPKNEMIAMIRGTGEGLPEEANARLIAAAPALLEDGKALAEEIDAIAAGEFGNDWADQYGPLYKLLQRFKETAVKAEGTL